MEKIDDYVDDDDDDGDDNNHKKTTNNPPPDICPHKSILTLGFTSTTVGKTSN